MTIFILKNMFKINIFEKLNIKSELKTSHILFNMNPDWNFNIFI